MGLLQAIYYDYMHNGTDRPFEMRILSALLVITMETDGKKPPPGDTGTNSDGACFAIHIVSRFSP